MNWTIVYGFLTFTFIVHFVAFALLHARTRKRPHLLLCGTFLCLATLFALKFKGLDWPLGIFFTVQTLLRIFAGAFTALALYLGWKKMRKEYDEIPMANAERKQKREKRKRRIRGRFG